ncbi:hypothetical protein ACFW96_29035 [Streptomyces gardneri]|uniref:hypothetical protein n=1 Tax=Streptomyces gardneri TaxID=66892 RepID=UPI0036A5F7C1
MRRQVEGEEEHRREDRGPHFAVEDVHIESNGRHGTLTLRQISGPALSAITVTVTGDGVHGKMMVSFEPLGTSYEDSFEIGPLATGGTVTVPFALERTHAATKVILHLDCRSTDSTVSWRRSVATTVDPLSEYRRRTQE